MVSKNWQVGEGVNIGEGMEMIEYKSERRGNAGSQKTSSSMVIVILIRAFHLYLLCFSPCYSLPYNRTGVYFVLFGWRSARRVLGVYGHNHENCQKNVKTSESSGKSRRIRLSKNSVDCSSGGGAVREIWWVLHVVGIPYFVVSNQLGAYYELRVTTTRIARKT